MMRSAAFRRSFWPRLAAACVLVLAARAAAGDWLVTRDGARVETKGAWEVKGKVVVFTTAAGDLASLRAADVDLEASRKATEDAKAAAAQQAAGKGREKRKPVRVLTDKDFPRRVPAPAPAAAEQGAAKQPAGAAGEKQPAAGTAGQEEAAPLQVTSWERAQAGSDGHLAIKGALHNGSADDAAGATLLVRVYDEAGQVIASVQAALTTTVLPAGGSTAFTADFPGVFAFAAVNFEGTSMRLRTTPEPPPPPSPTGG